MLAKGKGGNDTFIGNRGDDLLLGDLQALGKHARLVGGGKDFLRGGRGDDAFQADRAMTTARAASVATSWILTRNRPA